MLNPINSVNDFNLIIHYLKKIPYEDSIFNIGNLVQWNAVYPIYFEEDEQHRFVLMFSKRSNDETWTSYVPLCEPQYYEEALYRLHELFDELEVPFQMKWVPAEVLEMLKPFFRPEATVETTDDESDYLYLAEDHRSMAGKKMQKKRNHINSFISEYQGRFDFKVLTPNDRYLITDYLEQWRIRKGSDNLLLNHEMQGIPAMLKYWEVQNLRAGGLFIDHLLVGFVLVVVTDQKTVQINVEKAEGDIRGAYPYLQQQTLQVLAPEALMINREDDGGVDYLRKAKQSMHPIRMLQKWTIKEPFCR